MIFRRQGRIARSWGRARKLIWAPSKEMLMHDYRVWFWASRIRNREKRLSLCWLFRCLALPLLVALVSSPAAAKFIAYVPTHNSSSVAVNDTMLDRANAVNPVQQTILAVVITTQG